MTTTRPTVTVEIDFTTNLSAGLAYYEKALVDGPYLYYRLKETSGTAATDASGNGKTGTYAGSYTLNLTPSPVTGEAAARFIDLNAGGRIGYPAPPPTTPRVTLEAWVYRSSLDGSASTFYRIGEGVGGGEDWMSFSILGNGKLNMASGFGNATTSTAPISAATWYHVACVMDVENNTILFYVNGVLLETSWAFGGPYVGFQRGSATWYWGGFDATRSTLSRIAEPAVYTQALQPSVLLDHYNAAATTPFSNYTWTNVTSYLADTEPVARRFGRESNLTGVTPMEMSYRLLNKDRRFEVEYPGVIGNYITNPSFENGLAGWSQFGNADARSHDTSSGVYGTDSMKILRPAVAGSLGAQSNTVTATAGSVWTVSVWIKYGTTPSGQVTVAALELPSQRTVSATVVEVAGGWSRYEAEITMAAGQTGVAMLVYHNGTTPADDGELFNLDAAQIESGATLTTYLDGDTGGVWSGVAHASATHRIQNYYPNVVPGRPTRITMTQDAVTYDWAFGFIQDFPQDYPAGDLYGTVPIVARCQLERMNQDDMGVRTFHQHAAYERMTVVLNIAGQPAGRRTLDAGANQMMAQTVESGSPGDHATQVARSDRGVFFFDGAGYAIFQDGTYRTTNARSTVVQGTLGRAEIDYGIPNFHSPKSLIVNVVQLQRPGGVMQEAVDSTSRGKHGRRPHSDELLLTTDALLATRAAAILADYKDPTLRIRSVTFNPQASTGHWVDSLGVKLSDRYTWTFQPMQGPAISRDVFVEGVSDTYGFREGEYLSTWTLSVAGEASGGGGGGTTYGSGTYGSGTYGTP